MRRSLITIDLTAIRDNARCLAATVAPTGLWGVVKADAYGHGAADVAGAALRGGVAALCVATIDEALALRAAEPSARLIVLGPTAEDRVAAARDATIEIVVEDGVARDGVRTHLKLDTGMGRWGLSELVTPGRDVVGIMTHLATADDDPGFATSQLERFLEATSSYAHLERHVANSAAALTLPAARLDAVRCGIALYGIDPFGQDAGRFGLRPALTWSSEIARVRRLDPGESTGYGRRFVAERATWIGLVPVGYADGFRRDLSGAEVLVGDERCRVVGTVSMDAFAVELPGPVAVGAPVTLVGGGITIEQLARVAGTIGYEIACGIRSGGPRAEREVTV